MRFTLRDLFWLTLTVSLTLGFALTWIDAERREIAAASQRDLARRHAEALRRELDQAHQVQTVLVEKLDAAGGDGSGLIKWTLVPVDWDLATREIP